MKLRFVLLALIFFNLTSIGQRLPFHQYQHFSKETIKANRIKMIEGYEMELREDHFIPDTLVEKWGKLQTRATYDTQGRLTNKLYAFPYSDQGDIEQRFFYDNKGQLERYFKIIGGELERAEIIRYDGKGKIISWFMNYKNKYHYQKQYVYDVTGRPAYTQILNNNSIIYQDSIRRNLDSQGRVIKEQTMNLETGVVDSMVIDYDRGDTVFQEQVYEDGTLQCKNFLVNFTDSKFYRTEEYIGGSFLSVNYREFNSFNNIILDKTIHKYSEVNYTKKFYYDENNIVSYKLVHLNSVKPRYIVKYKITYYPIQ